MKHKIKMLSEKAAVEDALYLYHEIGNFLMVYVKIAAGQKHEDKESNMTGEKFLEQIEVLIKKSIFEQIKQNVSLLYAYARNEISRYSNNKEYTDITFKDKLDELYSYFVDLFLLFAVAQRSRLSVSEAGSMDLIEKVCPRLAYAFKIAFARRELIRAFNENGCISPNSLALLAGVGYTYIIKLIRKGKMPAVKKNRQWCISAGDAIEFLSKYTENDLRNNVKDAQEVIL